MTLLNESQSARFSYKKEATMFAVNNRMKSLGFAALVLAASTCLTAPAFAQDAAAPAAVAPSDSAMVNLVRLLIAQGTLSKEKGEALMAQASAEAQTARATQQASSALAPPPPGAVRVPYIPETVRSQIKDELRTEVFSEAKKEGWATAGTIVPEWTKRITVSGDVRIRSESDLYSKSNSNQIFDYAAENRTGVISGPGNAFLPTLNTRVDRDNLLRARLRLDFQANINKHVTAGLQLASGDDNSPISTNFNLGGGFGKRAIWLQKAYLDLKPTDWATVHFGRFTNPFLYTDLVFDDDISFDGVAATVGSSNFRNSGLGFFLRGGAFPLSFGDANYPSQSFDKLRTPHSYLLSGQAEVDAQIAHKVDIKVGVAYHDFTHLQGKVSNFCDTRTGYCSTDNLIPQFLRKGNTLFFLRNIDTVNSTSLLNYYGLQFNYHLIDINAVVRFPVSSALTAGFNADFVDNVGFKRRDICRNNILGEPQNNYTANPANTANSLDVCAATTPATFNGGNKGYMAKFTIGYPSVRHWGQWSFEGGYRYLETDAVLDAFTDSDFHLGGTNAKGYFVAGKTGLYDGTTLGVRWMSANQVSGDPFGLDILQVDLEAKF